MIIVIHPGSQCTVTSFASTQVISLMEMMLVKFVSNLVFAFGLDSNLQVDMKLVGSLLTQHAGRILPLVCTTRLHAQSMSPVSHFGHCN
jgi:hypothetical protein